MEISHGYDSTASSYLTTVISTPGRSRKSGRMAGSLVSLSQNHTRARFSSMLAPDSTIEDRRKIGSQETRDLTDFVSKRLDAILSQRRHHDTLEI